jgi:hypothetical protein
MEKIGGKRPSNRISTTLPRTDAIEPWDETASFSCPNMFPASRRFQFSAPGDFCPETRVRRR